MEQLKSLVKSRARLKSNITRVLAWAEQTKIATHIEIVTRIDILNEVWKEFNQFSDCIAIHRQRSLRSKILKGKRYSQRKGVLIYNRGHLQAGRVAETGNIQTTMQS